MEASPIYLDLHVHSSFSDGAFSPAELIQRAKRNGLKAIALADHDSIAGVAQAIVAGIEHGIEVIPAVELSVQFENWHDIHLLGYGLDFQDEFFLNKLNYFKEMRVHRNIRILEGVNKKLGNIRNMPPITLAEVLVHAKGTIGRPHIARALLERGYVTSIEEAFRSYLVPCNIPKAHWPIKDAINEIKRIGGIPVLAHPTSISIEHPDLRRIILDMRDLGLEGIEVYNNMARPEDMEFLRRLAEEFDLMVSAGSDFHGIEEGLEIGRGRGGIRFNDTLLAPLWEAIGKPQH
ncbi:PHP domain-containing protein [Pelotalea chapellei]|uniref:PHP domain-containing protein n=1 Tax=Pelotalea chapellei TaxID=44671 RepID=A0ABS5UD26_9BACT|nr:PHP domain-containing protein [Pelotalea chapellei]MBT1073528.1 PHP domain-containing protein [Pelotalea chapellei]